MFIQKIFVFLIGLSVFCNSFAMLQEKTVDHKPMVQKEESADELLEELFLGTFCPEKIQNYFKALEVIEDEYNQSISSASLFLGGQLEQLEDKELASLAYAYACYYDPYNEDINLGTIIKKQILECKALSEKKDCVKTAQKTILSNL